MKFLDSVDVAINSEVLCVRSSIFVSITRLQLETVMEAVTGLTCETSLVRRQWGKSGKELEKS